MSAPRNFIGGFNHNIRYQGELFHVQTEDSGEPSSAVKTHLFIGGTIIATRKTSYAEAAGTPDLPGRVRTLMEEQHKQMLRDLLAGRFDANLGNVIAFQPGQLGTQRQEEVGEVDLDDLLDDILIEEVVVATAAVQPRQAQPNASANGAATRFGEGLVSDRSLDEVILAYLSGED